MIVVDTSALLAILLEEPAAKICRDTLAAAPDVRISAGTLCETLIVAAHRGHFDEMKALVDELGIAVEPVAAADADRVARAHALRGKGVNPAGLNFGDCFAYALAKERGCPLLYAGADFARTDLRAATQE